MSSSAWFRPSDATISWVMDNFRTHKIPGVREAIEKAGATVRYLPPRPISIPIELPSSKFKTLLRKAAARTAPALFRTIRSFIPQLSLKNVPTISGM
jgi:transposase